MYKVTVIGGAEHPGMPATFDTPEGYLAYLNDVGLNPGEVFLDSHGLYVMRYPLVLGKHGWYNDFTAEKRLYLLRRIIRYEALVANDTLYRVDSRLAEHYACTATVAVPPGFSLVGLPEADEALVASLDSNSNHNPGRLFAHSQQD